MFIKTTLLITVFTVAATLVAPEVFANPNVELIELPVIDIQGEIKKGQVGGKTDRCGGDCRNEGSNSKTNTNTTLTPATQAKSQQQLELEAKQQLELEAKQAFEDEALLYARKLRLDEKPLENESMIIKWLLGKAKGKVIPIGPWGTVLDSLEPAVTGVSEFDQAKDKTEMKRLREEIEAEERQLKREREQNIKLYEENMRLLEPKLSPEEISRGLASLPELNRMQEALVARARLRSEDYGYVVEQLLKRTRFDAEIPMPTSTYKRVSREIWRITPSNVCATAAGPCVLNGFPKGQTCSCPNPMGIQYAPVWGKTSRFPLGSICRNGNVSTDLQQLYPAQVQCGIPVNTSLNPGMPFWEYLPGKVSVK